MQEYIHGIGAWRLVCEDSYLKTSKQTQADRVWDLLSNIHKYVPGLFQKPPEKIWNGSSTYIICYTFDHTDVAAIRHAAEFIRSRVRFPYAINYFECSSVDLKKQQLLFQHTPEGELYKHSIHSMKLVASSQSVKPCVDSSSKRLLPRPPLHASLLPSEVFDSTHLYMPSTEEGIEKLTSRKGGKWMVFSDSLASHDSAWTALLPLHRRGVLAGLKASTSVLSPPNMYCVPGFVLKDAVILCYTADSEDREDVRRTVLAIRSVLGRDHMMFYKPNAASWNGDYYHEGKKSVTKYQHTVEGGLYERDHLKRFVLIIPGRAGPLKNIPVDSSRKSGW